MDAENPKDSIRSAANESAARAGSSRNALSVLFSLHKERKTGILTVTNGSSRRAFSIKDGILNMIWVPDNPGYFRTLVLGVEKLKEKKLTRLLRDEHARASFLPEAVSAAGLVPATVLKRLLRETASREIISRSQQKNASLLFEPGSSDLRFLGSRVEKWELGIDLIELVVEASRKKGLVEESLADVLVNRELILTRAAKKTGQGLSEETEKVLAQVTGRLSVGELIQSEIMPSFDLWVLLTRMEAEGLVRRLTASETVSVAECYRKEGRTDKALHLYLAAEEMGASNSDLTLTIGRTFDLMGDGIQAIERYLDYACPQTMETSPDAALEVLRQVLVLDRENVEARQRLIVLLERKGAKDDLVVEYRGLAQVCRESGRLPEALNALERVVALGKGDGALFAEMAALASAGGGSRDAIPIFRKMASEYAGSLPATAARQLHEYLSQLEPDAVDVKVELGRALEKEGRSDAAHRVYLEILEHHTTPGASTPQSMMARLQFAAERVLASDPVHEGALSFLAELSARENDQAGARALFGRLAKLHGDAGDAQARAEALSRLVELGEEDTAVLRDLARAQVTCGREDLAVKTLVSLADSLLSSNELVEAQGIYEEVLQVSPFEMQAHRMLVSCLSRSGDRRRLVPCLEDLARLACLTQDHEAQVEALTRLIELEPRKLSWRSELARVFEVTGREDELVHLLLDLGRAEDLAGNRGYAMAACEWILRVIPGHTQASTLLSSLQKSSSGSTGYLLPDGGQDEALTARISELEDSLKSRLEEISNRIPDERASGLSSPPVTLPSDEQGFSSREEKPIPSKPSPQVPVDDEVGKREIPETKGPDIGSIVEQLKQMRG